MDVKGALEAVEAIRGTVPLSEQANFDAELATRLGLVSEAAGTVAVEGARQAETEVEATPYTKESIAEQLSTSFRGYQFVVDSLNSSRKPKDILFVAAPETLATEFEAWFTEDKLAYVTAAQEADPSMRFTLVATPNVLADHKDIIKVAEIFGKSQPYETYVYDTLYKKYSAQELSGTDPDNGNAVVFSLIPSNYTPEMGGTVIEQRAKLAKLQTENPDLKVPSVLESVTYWQTLRAQGQRLADNTTFDRTYIRHFDLPEKRVDDWSDVPGSYVGVDGKPRLDGSRAGNACDGRLSVG